MKKKRKSVAGKPNKAMRVRSVKMLGAFHNGEIQDVSKNVIVPMGDGWIVRQVTITWTEPATI